MYLEKILLSDPVKYNIEEEDKFSILWWIFKLSVEKGII